MSSEWPILTLDDVCEKITDGAHNSPKSVSHGKPMASVKDLTRFGVNLSDARLISHTEFEKLVKQGCQPMVGDVLIAKDGNSALDTVCTVDKPLDAVMLSSVAILRPNKEKLDSDFLKYYFCSSSIIEYLKNNFISGAAIPRVVLKDFKKAEIKTPPLSIQRNISKILRSLDDKIRLNGLASKTLEQIAQTIFKSWFVDFDPVKAKISVLETGGTKEAAELAAMTVISGKDEAQLAQLKIQDADAYQQLAQAAALFPAAMQESELGKIPIGWEIRCLSDVVEIGSAKRIRAEEYTTSGVPFYRGKEITELSNGSNIKPEIFISEERFNELHKKFGAPKGNDILITSVGTIGNTYLVNKEDKFYFKDGNLTWIKHYKNECIPFFLKAWFDSDIGKEAIESIKIGSTQQAITIASINKLKLVLPTDQIHKAFENCIGFNYRERRALLEQIKTLSELMDSLLPKLLSGELSFSDMEFA